MRDQLQTRRTELQALIRTLDQQLGVLLAQRNVYAGALMQLDDLLLGAPEAPPPAPPTEG